MYENGSELDVCNWISATFIQGVDEFINRSKLVLCPCCDCNNSRGYRDVDQIKDHLICRGLKSNYTRWIWHEEFCDQGMSCTSLCDDLHVDHIDDEVEVDIEKGEDDNENDR